MACSTVRVHRYVAAQLQHPTVVVVPQHRALHRFPSCMSGKYVTQPACLPGPLTCEASGHALLLAGPSQGPGAARCTCQAGSPACSAWGSCGPGGCGWEGVASLVAQGCSSCHGPGASRWEVGLCPLGSCPCRVQRPWEEVCWGRLSLAVGGRGRGSCCGGGLRRGWRCAGMLGARARHQPSGHPLGWSGRPAVMGSCCDLCCMTWKGIYPHVGTAGGLATYGGHRNREAGRAWRGRCARRELHLRALPPASGRETGALENHAAGQHRFHSRVQPASTVALLVL